MRRPIIVVALLLILVFPAGSQTRRFRVAIGGLSAESNSLYPATLVMSEERRGGAQTPAEWLADMEKSNTVASGVIAAARTLPLDIVPVLRAGAGSLGMVEAASFNAKLGELVQQLKTASPPFDGVILGNGWDHTRRPPDRRLGRRRDGDGDPRARSRRLGAPHREDRISTAAPRRCRAARSGSRTTT